MGDGLERECRRAAARFGRLVVGDGDGIAGVCRERLARDGVVVGD